MKIRDLQEMITRDCHLDPGNLTKHSLETAYLQGKYFNLYVDELAKLKALEPKLNNLKKQKYEYYKGNADPSVYKEKPFDLKLGNSAAQAYTDSDEEVMTLQRDVDIQKIKIDLINDMKGALSQRNWQIKNAIDHIKFNHGER